MSFTVSGLKESITLGKPDRIKQELSTLSSTPNLQISEIDTFLALLNFENPDILKQCAEATADLAKTEENRLKFTDERIIKALIELMCHPDKDVVHQALRALGNICYENEASSVLVGERGLRVLFKLVMENPKGKLASVGSGLLLNLLAPCQSLQKASLELKALDVLEKVLTENAKDINENEFLFVNMVTVLSFLLEYLEEVECISKQLCSVIVDILKNSTNMEICSLCIDVLHVVSENSENLHSSSSSCKY